MVFPVSFANISGMQSLVLLKDLPQVSNWVGPKYN